MVDIVERRERSFVAAYSNLEERRAIERAGGTDPGPEDVQVSVAVNGGASSARVVELLRALATRIEQEG